MTLSEKAISVLSGDNFVSGRNQIRLREVIVMLNSGTSVVKLLVGP